MYSENNRRVSVHRANDDFLRRMLGGELVGGEVSVMNDVTETLPSVPTPPSRMNVRNGGARLSDEGSMNDRPSCDGSVDGEGEVDGGCPTYLHAPSLAMVYAPRQCWRNLLDPEAALENGTQFAELVLPFEGGHHGNCRETEVNGRR